LRRTADPAGFERDAPPLEIVVHVVQRLARGALGLAHGQQAMIRFGRKALADVRTNRAPRGRCAVVDEQHALERLRLLAYHEQRLHAAQRKVHQFARRPSGCVFGEAWFVVFVGKVGDDQIVEPRFLRQ
jgi:hypothetical protein